MISNPILQREMRCALRKGRPFVLMLAYVAVLAAVITCTYPSGKKIDLTASTIGREIFITFSIAQLLMVLLVTPAVAVASLAAEREKGTLETLLVAPVTQWEIVVGKFMASLFHVMLLVIASLPLTAVAFMLGGVSPAELVASYVTVFAVAGVCAAVGILFIATQQRPLAAAANAYLSMPIYLGGLAILSVIGSMGGALLFFESVLAFSYMTALRQTTRTASYLGMSVCCFSFVPLVAGYQSNLASEGYIALAIAGAAGALVLGCLVSAAKRLEYASMAAPVRSASAIMCAGRPQTGMIRRRMIADWINPVLGLELRRSPWFRSGSFRGTLLFFAVAGLTTTIAYAITEDWLVRHSYLSTLTQAHLLLIMALGATAGALTIAPEVERKTIGQLCVCPLSSLAIVLGKFAAACLFPFTMAAMFMPVLVLAAHHGSLSREAVETGVALAVVSAIAATSLGLFISVYWSRSRLATGIALSCVLLLGGHALLHQMMTRTDARILSFWPMYTPDYRSGFLDPLVLSAWFQDSNAWQDLRAASAVAVCLMLAGLSAGLLGATLYLFNRRRSQWS